MSAVGTVHIYRTKRIPNVDAAMQRFARLSGVERVKTVNRNPARAERLRWIVSGRPYYTEEVGRDIPIVDLKGLHRERWVTHLWLHGSRWQDRMFVACRQDLASAIRGEFVLCDVFASIGWSDLVDTAGRDDAVVVARPFLQIQLYGGGWPHDPLALNEALPQMAVVQEVRATVEECFGDVQICVLWDF